MKYLKEAGWSTYQPSDLPIILRYCLFSYKHYLEKKNSLSFIFNIMIISYISIQNYVKEINTIWKCPLLRVPDISFLLFDRYQQFLKNCWWKRKKKLWLSHCLIKTTKIWIGKIKKKCPLILIDLLLVHTRVYHIWRTKCI